MHCDSGTAEAFFGGGTKLTVLGKKSFTVNIIKHFLNVCFGAVKILQMFN